ncbi:MAG: hypothetical protein JNG88_15300 [Phycisphaerales bacterium]|nr:hypothetical protein [Phycisphaerales bacterium]
MIAMSGEQVVVFAIIAAAGYWVVSLVLNKVFPSRSDAETEQQSSQMSEADQAANDPERARRSAEMRSSFPPPPESMNPPGLRRNDE